MNESPHEETRWDREVYEALAAHAEISGWDDAEPYLKRHAAEHAASADQIEDLLPKRHYLSNADANTLLPLLRTPLDREAQALSAAFRSSADFHRSEGSSKARSQRLLLDQARAGTPSSSEGDSESFWKPQWCVGSTLHPAQIDILRHGDAVFSVTFEQLDGRPVALTGSDDHTVRIWDLNDGSQIDRLDFPAPVNTVAFGAEAGLLVGYGSEFARFDPPRQFRSRA